MTPRTGSQLARQAAGVVFRAGPPAASHCPLLSASCWRRIIGNRRRWAIARRATRAVGIARGATVPRRHGTSPLRLARAATTCVLRSVTKRATRPRYRSGNIFRTAATTANSWSQRRQPALIAAALVVLTAAPRHCCSKLAIAIRARHRTHNAATPR